MDTLRPATAQEAEHCFCSGVKWLGGGATLLGIALSTHYALQHLHLSCTRLVDVQQIGWKDLTFRGKTICLMVVGLQLVPLLDFLSILKALRRKEEIPTSDLLKNALLTVGVLSIPSLIQRELEKELHKEWAKELAIIVWALYPLPNEKFLFALGSTVAIIL
jgi:hypothetical protein